MGSSFVDQLSSHPCFSIMDDNYRNLRKFLKEELKINLNWEKKINPKLVQTRPMMDIDNEMELTADQQVSNMLNYCCLICGRMFPTIKLCEEHLESLAHCDQHEMKEVQQRK